MIAQRRFRAPADDGTLLAVPALFDVGDLLASNREIFTHADTSFGGMSLTTLRAEAIAEIRQVAVAYLADAGQPIKPADHDRFIVTGHQPELAHPGVWIKNFAAAKLARHHGIGAINLIIDTDVPKSGGIKLPTWDASQRERDPASVRQTHVAFDPEPSPPPYSEWQVSDARLWESFPERVRSEMSDWNEEPLVSQFWHAMRDQEGPIGERFSHARRAIERQWGVTNLELPISKASSTIAFARLAWHILTELPRFIEIHNQSVRDYRRAHKIRSRSHPVPELASDGDRLEAPFWAWRRGGSSRQRLFVTRTPTELCFEFGSEDGFRLPIDQDGFIERWRDLDRRGIAVRSRALTTTLFARLCLADVFIHGIGGGKYDELTDALMSDFFGVRPPGFLVLSATLHLPLEGHPGTSKDLGQLTLLERDYHWNPQRYLGSQWDHVCEQKRRLIQAKPHDRVENRRWFRELREVTTTMRPGVATELEQVRQRRREMELALRANAILKRRDYASILFPSEYLQLAFQSLLIGLIGRRS